MVKWLTDNKKTAVMATTRWEQSGNEDTLLTANDSDQEVESSGNHLYSDFFLLHRSYI